MKLKYAGLLSFSSVLALSACLNDAPEDPASGTLDGMAVQNEERDLEDRLTERDEEILVEDSTGALSKVAAKNFTMTLIAEISPPSVRGESLQATSVHLQGGFAYISYNLRGEEYGGGVDVVQIRSGRNAVIRSSVVYEDADVHALHFDDDLYLATASSDAAFSTPALLERMEVKGGKLVLKERSRAPLNSFAATSVTRGSGRIFATSGNTGGLHVLAGTSMEGEAVRELADARWVDVDDARIVVVQGTPGRVAVYDNSSLAQLNSWPFAGADIPESKTTVRVLGGKALIAAGTGGTQLMNLGTGKIVGSVPVPVVEGLDSTKTVANAADADGDLIYVSNGEAGVYAVQASGELRDNTGDDDIALTVLGKLRFQELQSVNHVAFNGNTLVVASGLGGIKIVSVRPK